MQSALAAPVAKAPVFFAPPRLPARLYWSRIQGSYEEAGSLAEQSVALCRELGEPKATAQSLNTLANVSTGPVTPRRAAPLYEEASTFARQSDDGRVLATVIGNLGGLALYEGRFDRARELVEECLALER